jgi:hypothetical protein
VITCWLPCDGLLVALRLLADCCMLACW